MSIAAKRANATQEALRPHVLASGYAAARASEVDVAWGDGRGVDFPRSRK